MPKHIVLTDEAKNGITKKHKVSEKRLLAMLQETDENTMPTSEEVRWMAFQLLASIVEKGTGLGKYTFSKS